MTSNQRVTVLASLLLGLLAWLGWQAYLPERVLPSAVFTTVGRASPTQPTVIFVVLDTVRSDHLSACGYERPTSPNLERMIAEGAAFTCGAVSPASWTVPSHASYFTGLDTPHHGATFAPPPAEYSFVLRDDVPTLAEEMLARGYQTISVSGNPLVQETTGLTRGFEVALHSADFIFDAQLLGRLERALWWHADDRPLFLFLNIADAHEPWPDVPAGLGWVEAAEGMAYDRGTPNPEEPFVRFMRDEMTPEERTALVRRVTDLYDYGVWRADDVLARALTMLEDHGWLEGGYRLVLTSDHGEHLGDRGLLDHGRYLWEDVVRVPLLVQGTEDGLPSALPSPLWAVHARDLARDGRLPAELEPPRSHAFPNTTWQQWFGRGLGESFSVAVWQGDDKLLQTDDAIVRYDLASDPNEQHPLAVPEDHPALEVLADGMDAALTHFGREPTDADAQVIEALKAAGYLGDD
ncbi:MAG: hypothetical protein EP330_04900 [Deltaproteobacteria bacterium]|nr:MAG: hypothetical protein EP330_04900 [Deltaproteobacteria bacterium]